MNTSSRIIVALDFESAVQATKLVEQLGSAATFYKIGLQLLTAEGPSVVRQLVSGGKQVFLDLKLLERSVAEVPLYVAMPVPDGLPGIGPLLLRSLVSLGIGYIIGSLVFGSFSEVQERKAYE